MREIIVKYVFSNVSLTSQKMNDPQITVHRVSEAAVLCTQAFFQELWSWRCRAAAVPDSVALPSGRPALSHLALPSGTNSCCSHIPSEATGLWRLGPLLRVTLVMSLAGI